MNAKKAKQLRQQARRRTQHLLDCTYTETGTTRLGECTRGAYKALKSGKFKVLQESVTL